MFKLLLRSTLFLSTMVGGWVFADPVIDDFERTNLGNNWRIIFGGDSPGIINNSDLGLKNNSTGFALVSWSAASFSADQFSEAVISSDKNSGILTQVFVRWRQSDVARYGFHYAGDPKQAVFGNWEIKYDGVPTPQTRSLATASAFNLPVPGDTLRIEISGFTIKGFHNGVEVISATDSDLVNRIVSGEPGLAYLLAAPETPAVYPAPVWESWFAGSLVNTTPSALTPDITVLDSSGTVDDLQITFGGVKQNAAAERLVLVRNDGDADLLIQKIAVDDPLSVPFNIQADNCTAVTLAVNTGCSFTVRFSPLSTNAFNDTFSITSDDPNENPVTVRVSGVGSSATAISSSGGSAVWSLILLVAGIIRRYTTS